MMPTSLDALRDNLLASSVPALLVELEVAGLELRADSGRLLVRPAERVTPKQRERLTSDRAAILLLLQFCDEAVTARRAVFELVLAQRGDLALPLLVFRRDVPYVAGRCYSCGEPTDRPAHGRCWRCAPVG